MLNMWIPMSQVFMYTDVLMGAFSMILLLCRIVNIKPRSVALQFLSRAFFGYLEFLA